jgi:WD40 repeat protein
MRLLLVALALAVGISGAAAQDAPDAVFFASDVELLFQPVWSGDTLYVLTGIGISSYTPGVDAALQPLGMEGTWERLAISDDVRYLIAQKYIAFDTLVFVRRSLSDGSETELEVDFDAAIVPSSSFSRDGRYAALLLPNYETVQIALRLYDLETGELRWTSEVDPELGFVGAVTFDADGSRVFVYGETSVVPIYDAETGARVGEVNPAPDDETELLTELQFSPNGRFLYLLGRDRIHVYGASGGDWRIVDSYPLDVPTNRLALSADGSMLISTAYPSGESQVWSVDGVSLTPESRLSAPDSSWVMQTAISGDGRGFATIDELLSLRVWWR